MDVLYDEMDSRSHAAKIGQDERNSFGRRLKPAATKNFYKESLNLGYNYIYNKVRKEF